MVLKNPAWLAFAAILLLLMLLLPGCYLMQATTGQLAVMRARQPIDELIARPSTSEALKEQLLRARRVRDFASAQLGLPDNDSYRSYADIGRPYVVWNVVATPEFSVEPLQWCFPFVGCLAYRGYFKQAAAEAFAGKLKVQGNDVLVGGIPAYSTLGHIADPLLSTVAGYSELDLAALVFHELAHQVAYLQGDTAYNEAFATAVEEEGVARYAARYADAAMLATWQRRQQFNQQVVALFAAARADLEALYRTRIAPEAMRARKAGRLARLGEDVHALEEQSGLRSGYGTWAEEGLNNAHLASIATYHEQVPHFRHLLKDGCGDYLPCLYVRVNQEMAARKSEARP
jgi:predicted aminopeptidase